MEHIVTTQHNTGMKFTSDIDNFSILMDSSENGLPGGPSPKKLMLASLAGCTGIDVVSILTKMQVSYSEFNITTIARLTTEHPKIYDNIKIIYKVKVDEINHQKFKRAVDLSIEKYCGVMAMYRHFAKIETEIVFL
ncbi:MAG: OsmC family protein [Ferruginibacter sp.]|nr:OsmC family protein [Ferruginibacter sp.]